MISTVFTFVVVGLMLTLCAHEILRYRASLADGGGIAATRKILSRRLGIALLVIATVLIINYWPSSKSLWLNIALLGSVSISLLLILLLTLRDLHETSITVVQEHGRLQAEAERAFESLQSKRNGGQAKKPRRR